jgi:hypothetical protein
MSGGISWVSENSVHRKPEYVLRAIPSELTLAPVLTHKDASGCIRVSEKTLALGSSVNSVGLWDGTSAGEVGTMPLTNYLETDNRC